MSENPFISNLRLRPAIHVKRMADDLRKLADALERHVIQYGAHSERPAEAHRLAGRVVHELSWGWANLNFDLVNQSAIDIDEALRAAAELEEPDWEYSVGGHENVVFSSKDEAALYNTSLVAVDIDPGTIVRRTPGARPGEWEVAP